MRYFFLMFLVAAVAVVSIAGFRGSLSRKPPIEVFADMDRQPKLRPQAHADFWPDRMSSRLHVAGTVPQRPPLQIGDALVYPYEDNPANTGQLPGTTNFVELNPFPITGEFLQRGQERFNISCAPCHGQQGDGKGVTTKLGMTVIADLHDAKARRVPQQPDGELFYTISNGKGQMQGYAGTISPPDRWAVIAYVRVLQRAWLANADDMPPEMRSKLPGVAPAK